MAVQVTMSAGQSIMVTTIGNGLNAAPNSTRPDGVVDLDVPVGSAVHSPSHHLVPAGTSQMLEDFEARKQAARVRMIGAANATTPTNAVIGVAQDHTGLHKMLPATDGNVTTWSKEQRETATALGTIVRCGAASNVRECIFTATSSGSYIFNWGTRSTFEVVSLRQISVSFGRSMGTVVVPVPPTALSCCSTSFPANPTSCIWSDVREVRYDMACPASTGYPGQTIRVTLSAGDEILVLSGGNGLM